jgi:2'-5' RNA ligase
MIIEAYSYSCLMALLPESVADAILRHALSIPDADIYGIDDPERGRETNPHVTVKYGIHSADPMLVSDVLLTQGSGSFRLGGMSAFQNEENTVLKIDVDGEYIHNLNALVSGNLDCTDTHPVYQPHVTVAYLKNKTGVPDYWKRYASNRFCGIEVPVENLVFTVPTGQGFDIPLVGVPDDMNEKIRTSASRMLSGRF